MPVARPQVWAVFSLQCAQLLRWVLRVPSEIGDLAARTRTAVEFARTVEVVEFGADARDEWASVYPALSAGRPGLLGAVTARAEAQTMRLALMYALLDRSPKMRLEHLRADQLGRERTDSTGDRGSMVLAVMGQRCWLADNSKVVLPGQDCDPAAQDPADLC